MDSITQIALGAAVGEAALGRKVGNKAVLWGAVAGTIPDLDVIPGQFLSTLQELEFHRGASHSIVFSVIMAPILGYLVYRLHKNSGASWRGWTLLFFLSLITHPVLDCLTTWGTQFFWPLDYRVDLKSISVIDPLYTLPLLITTIWLMFKSRSGRGRRVLNVIGISLSSFYLIFTLGNKAMIHQIFEEELERQNISYNRFDTRPTLFNNILWTSNVEADSGYYLGYYSFLDPDESIHFRYIHKNEELLGEVENEPKVKRLLKITQDWYTLEKEGELLLVNDLRFGQTMIWPDENERFVFTYTIEKDNGEVIIGQRENDFSQGTELLSQLWHRLKGHKNPPR
ncbi:MAG: metal-dependent hydrolase [Bacteroidia bacterium]